MFLLKRNCRRPRELLTRPFCLPWDSLTEPVPCYSPTSPSVPRLGKTRFIPVPVSLKLCCSPFAPCSSAGFRSGLPVECSGYAWMDGVLNRQRSRTRLSRSVNRLHGIPLADDGVCRSNYFLATTTQHRPR
ncbi:hypothetical protein LI328DRAFT_131604 [Trichoderma asperelloides]|nr:hypothetical protein LI328DRAFT_131604 [Trichoderma asperelloides]